MITRRRQKRERIRRNKQRRKRWYSYDIQSLEIWIGGVRIEPSGYAPDYDLLTLPPDILLLDIEPTPGRRPC